MKSFNIIGGLPRAGTTLASQILNSNPNFHVTPTSGIIDVLKNIRSTFSHNATWKAQDRLQLMPNIQAGMKGFIDGFFGNEKVIFDKCRGWSNNISMLDAVLGNNDTKIIWFYRDVVEIVGSVESAYQKTILLENADEAQAAGAFATLDRRVGTFINNDSIISYPIEILRDAIEMGYGSRILLLKYYDLCNSTQNVMNLIHEFIGEPIYAYDLQNIKQTTRENDSTYNYKFTHQITEGQIKWKKADILLPQKYINAINERFAPLNTLMFTGDASALLNLPPGTVMLNVPGSVRPEAVPDEVQNVAPVIPTDITNTNPFDTRT